MTSRAKILIFIKGLGLGGAEKLILGSAAFWDRARFDYEVAYVLPWKDYLVEPLRDLGIPVRCIGTRRGYSLAVPARLRRLVGDVGASLVHAHLPTAGILARVVLGVPVVYTEHNVPESYRPLTRALNRLTYRRNAVSIAVSEGVARGLQRYPGRTSMIHNGVFCDVTDEQRVAVRTEMGIALDEPLVVHVGNIRPHKGHATLVAAVAELGRRFPGVRVVSIGGEKNAGDLERVRGMARAAGIESQLSFLGRRDDAQAFMAAADVVVNPSDFEGGPLSVLEGMQLSRAVVATRVGGVPHMIQDGVTGLLVEPGRPQDMAAALERALRDADLRARLGARACEAVTREYGLERMVRAVESEYERVLQRVLA